jgi:hypothetical protein
MPGSKILVCAAFAIGSIALAESSPELTLVDSSKGEACSESLRWDTLPSQPTGISLLRAQPHAGARRLFGIIPNYRAEQTQDIYKPLSTAEKYEIARRDSFDWPNYFLMAGYALQSQIGSGGFSHNGGIKGFGEFYARAAGDQIIGSYLTEAMMPAWLHEDPRFFRLGTGSFWHRFSYAATRIIITRGDDGRNRVFLSELVGNAGVVAITTAYYPTSRSAGEAFERYSQQLGNDAITNVMTEFWPDIRRRLHFHKSPQP